MRTLTLFLILTSSLAFGQWSVSGPVTISGPYAVSQQVVSLSVQTSTVPSGTQSAPYSQTLTATGGVPCGGPAYTWSVFSGSLPSGITLSSAGVLAGTTSSSGTFNFVAQAADCASHTAVSATLSLVINASGGGCIGTSPFPCSRVDSAVADVTSLPSWGSNTCSLGSATSCGNLIGANTTITDPAFGNTITRLSDNTYSNRSMQVTSGSGDLNRFATDSTFLVTQDTGGFDRFWSWNTSTKSGSRLYLSSLPSGLSFGGTAEFSRSSRTTAYLMPSISVTPKTALNKYDISNCTSLPSCGASTPPTAQLVYDFASSSNCLGAGFAATWTDDGGVAAADAAFASSFSNSGGQGGAGAKFAAVYVVGKGCILLNTATGAVTADTGFSGTTGLSCTGSGCTGSLAGWTSTFASGLSIHNNKLFRDGNTLEITPCFGSSPGCGIPCTVAACNNVVFWNINSTSFSQPSSSISGHFTEGYTTWVNNPASMKMVGRQVSSPGSTTAFTTTIPTVIDVHQGWNNADSIDSVPFCMSTFDLNVGTGFTDPYVNEIVCAKPDASNTRWRFAHTYNTNKSTSPNFGIEEVIGSVSQDGNWFMFGTDGMGQFGAENGSSSCTVGGTSGGTNCRGEVLIVPLR